MDLLSKTKLTITRVWRIYFWSSVSSEWDSTALFSVLVDLWCAARAWRAAGRHLNYTMAPSSQHLCERLGEGGDPCPQPQPHSVSTRRFLRPFQKINWVPQDRIVLASENGSRGKGVINGARGHIMAEALFGNIKCCLSWSASNKNKVFKKCFATCPMFLATFLHSFPERGRDSRVQTGT